MNLSIKFHGPISEDLLRVAVNATPVQEHTVLGQGPTRSVAAARALADTRHIDLPRELRQEVAEVVRSLLPEGPDDPQGDLLYSCSISFDLDRRSL
jgi:hypothetical protein